MEKRNNSGTMCTVAGTAALKIELTQQASSAYITCVHGVYYIKYITQSTFIIYKLCIFSCYM